MSDTWEVYFANVNDAIASLVVDLGIRDSVPDPERTWLLWCWVYFQQPDENGLSTSEEAPTLGEIEDSLTNSVKLIGAELVGRITTAGHHEFYFYGPRPNRFEKAVATAMRVAPGYEFDSGSQKDHEWSHYLNVLYPSPEDRQRIANRQVIESLESHGDSLEHPRLVSHWIYFGSAEDRSRFVTQAVRRGFKITDEFQANDSETSQPFSVTLERSDHVDWDTINEVTLDLFRLAQSCGGDYDGWETSVEKGG